MTWRRIRPPIDWDCCAALEPRFTQLTVARSTSPAGAPYPLVSAWVLEKRLLSEGETLGRSASAALTQPSAARLAEFLESARRGAAHAARLRHPCLLRVVEPLEETRTQLVLVTEPIFASLADVLESGTPSSTLPPELREERARLRLSELECKHGLLQVAEALHFLNAEAGIVHGAVSPGNLLISHSGAWKLAGFEFAMPLDYSNKHAQQYDYSDAFPTPLMTASSVSGRDGCGVPVVEEAWILCVCLGSGMDGWCAV